MLGTGRRHAWYGIRPGQRFLSRNVRPYGTIFARRYPHLPPRQRITWNHASAQARSLSIVPKPATFARLAFVISASCVTAYTYIRNKVNETKEALDTVAGLANDVKSKVMNNLSKIFGRMTLPSSSDSTDRISTTDDNSLVDAELHTEGSVDETQSKHNEKLEVFPELAKKLVGIRNVLKNVEGDVAMELPSIVVIGSQSAGKSSVLELIVGKRFLPKGNNMVTRRPLEITLVHTDPGSETFADVNGALFTDFDALANTLATLNASVKTHISSQAIDLKIFSPHVPDLTLIDLPGFIRVSAAQQPPGLKNQINELVNKYIGKSNLILAVCASDVDLANADALRASRLVDPKGQRTIGVLTKADLVEPERVARLLEGSSYPLDLGYIALNCTSVDGHVPLPFSAATGLKPLVDRLQAVLTQEMATRASGILEKVRAELEDVRYRFKVEYEGRHISEQGYVAEMLDHLKQELVLMMRRYGKKQMTERIKDTLHDQVVNIADSVWWVDEEWIKKGDPDWVAYWKSWGRTLSGYSQEPFIPPDVFKPDISKELDKKTATGSALLTKSGVGRSCTQIVVSELETAIEQVLEKEPFCNHPSLRHAVVETAQELLRGSRFRRTSEQVETALTPYKYDFECEENDWVKALPTITKALEERLEETTRRVRAGLLKLGGASKARAVLDNPEGHSSEAINAAQIVQSDQRRKRAIRRRIAAIKRSCFSLPTEDLTISGHDKSVSPSDLRLEPASEPSFLRTRRGGASNLSLENHVTPNSSVVAARYCPETFLSCLASQLALTSVLFIQTELIRDFKDQFPRLLERRILAEGSHRAYARESAQVDQHLRLQDKMEALERAAWELVEVVKIVERKKQDTRRYKD